jgi:hypothetical protein
VPVPLFPGAPLRVPVGVGRLDERPAAALLARDRRLLAVSLVQVVPWASEKKIVLNNEQNSCKQR